MAQAMTPFKLNLCSGQRPFQPPFINVDINQRWSPQIVCDGVNLAEHFGPGSADMICIHHGLEHFGCGEADAMLKACYDVLVPGGSLLIFVPDMPALAEAYFKGDIDDYIFMVNCYGAYMDSEADRHRFGYSAKSLSHTLKSVATWQAVKRFDWRKIEGADIAKDWWILGVEAVK